MSIFFLKSPNCTLFFIHSPGQALGLQARVSVESPVQLLPPCFAAWEIVLVALWVPPPQVFEQLPQVQSVHMQSTKTNNNFEIWLFHLICPKMTWALIRVAALCGSWMSHAFTTPILCRLRYIPGSNLCAISTGFCTGTPIPLRPLAVD